MEKPIISVVVPVYDTEKRMLKKCFDSIMKQSEKKLELIIIDDGSKKEIADYCDEYELCDDRVKVVHIKNSGASIARNIGIEKAEGEFITFVDADDWVSEKYIEDMLLEFKKDNFDIVMCTRFFEYKEKTISNHFFEGNHIFETLNKELLIIKSLTTGVAGTWCKIYRKDFINANNLRYNPKLRRTQDIIFNLYSFSKANKIKYIDECKYHYRMQNESITKKFNINIDSILTMAANEFVNFINNLDFKNFKIEQALYYKCILILNEILKLKYFNPNYKEKNKVIYAKISKLIKNEIYTNALNKYEIKNFPSLIGKVKIICLKKKWYFLLKKIYMLQYYIEHRRNY